MFSALTVIPVAAALAAAMLRDRMIVRVSAVAVIAVTFLVGFVGLIAPHRLAEEKLGTQQSVEWNRGALATRDVVYTSLPLVASCAGGLLVLALRPVRASRGAGFRGR